ncbi:trichohyalin isoform X2 [Myripristis murdjan]|uniref:trichohyalin isoform X2 n=1 Tax=Myripristis murdjan TaxID=586833 RepID=UPI001176454B|nr:trichohyalin-like isoform X2 [Myripristis murdjan]
MGTKRQNWTLFDTLSNPNTADRKHQPGGQLSRDPSPRPGTTAQSERERERSQEEDWRREREMERMREKARYKGKDMDPRERYSERDRPPAPRPREAERESRQDDKRNKNGRPLSNLEKETEREIERERKKGDTFPRMRRGSKERDRRMTACTETEEGRGGRRQIDWQKAIEIDDFERERERAWRRERQRDRETYMQDSGRKARRERENNRGRPMEDGTARQSERPRESDPGLRDRRRERDVEVSDLWDRRERDAARERERPRTNLGDREARVPSPRRRRELYADRDNREKAERRERNRDTKSEGDTDETEMRRRRVRDREREELMYQHSRSEGDNKGSTTRERERERQRHSEEDRQRYRERDRGRESDASRRQDHSRERRAEKDRERDRRKDREGERWRDNMRDMRGCRQNDRGWPGDRREGDRYREREDNERRSRERMERETDPRWDDAAGRGSRSQREPAPRPPPRAQSSGEWSSGMDSDRGYRMGRDSYEERESGRESMPESERDVEDEKSGRGAAERSRTEQKRSEKPDRDREERMSGASAQRRMWLEPQRGKNSKESSLEDEFIEMEKHTRRKERKRGGEERKTESQTYRGSQGRGVKEEQDESYSDQSKSRGRHCETRRHGDREEPMEKRGETDRRTEGVSVDGEEVGEAWRERDKREKGHLSDCDAGIEGSQPRDRERENVTDNTEESDREEEGGSDYYARSESEGGSETGWEQDRDRMLSGEDGFITVSSGGDGEDEREDEEFEDCREFWEVGANYDDNPSAGFERYEGEEERQGEWGEGSEGSVEEGGENGVGQEKEMHPKYVFCVIGQTLPRSKPNKMSEMDQLGRAGNIDQDSGNSQYGNDDITRQPKNDLHLVHSRDADYPMNNNNKETERDKYNMTKEERPNTDETSRVDIRYRVSPEFDDGDTGDGVKSDVEHPYAKIGPLGRDSQTEKLLKEWRERNEEQTGKESEQLPPSPINPYGEVSSHEIFVPIQPALDGINSATISPEEEEALQIRMSGAWSMSEEAKRHSQAPHLKWAKNVVREILGPSEEQAIDDPNSAQQGGQEVSQSDRGSERQEQVEEMTEGVGEMPIYAKVQKLKVEEQFSEPELDEGQAEPLELEEMRDDDDARSESWGEVELRNVLDTIGRRKRNSKFFNAAQLYQQYSEAAQNIEILRQSRSDVLSTCEDHSVHLVAPLPSSSPSSSPAPSPPPARRPLPPLPPVPHPHSLSHSGSISSTTGSTKSLPVPERPKIEGRPSSPRLSISLTQSATLWRELPAVRNSGGLEDLTEDQRRLQEVRFEVVTSEASYCRSLDIVVEHFVKSKQLGVLLTTQDRNWLFSRLADVRAISHSFLSKLEERVENDIMHFTVCDIIARHCQRFKMVYVPYLTNQSYQDATYQRLMNENAGFKRIVEKLERSPVCQRLPLRSFLVLPFQRITRIKLLVQNIVKRTAPDTEEVIQAIKALKLLEKLIQESNDSITQMKSIESLVSLSAKVDFECRTLPLISQSRRLLREGLVTELMDFSLKETERNVYLHLFNDYLLLSLHKEGGRFTVIDHAPVSDLRAENCRVKLHSLQKNLFRLHLSHKALLLRTDNQSDKLRWISAVSRPHPEIDFSAAQDFTQMQCIRAFVAQQPDELSLEKADIILVHQQSSDGWVEGTRLSDRHRGWMPESHLETITNPRVQQRNLSDALKLTTVTAAV